MTRVDRDEEREDRIAMEATVDAYTPYEQAIGWYYYLEERLDFPFEARCTKTREVSPLEEDEVVSVVGMSSVDACRYEMFVSIEWMDRTLGVPLAQLEPMSVSGETQEAIADWHYWIGRGYELC